MEQQNKYRVVVSARAAQMLVSHAALRSNLKRLQNLWSRCRSVARGSQANTFLKMLTDSSCLKNAICSSSRSQIIRFMRIMWQIADRITAGSSDNQQRRWLPFLWETTAFCCGCVKVRNYRNVLFAGELRAYDRVSCMIDQPLVGIISVYKLFFVAFIFKDS